MIPQTPASLLIAVGFVFMLWMFGVGFGYLLGRIHQYLRDRRGKRYAEGNVS
jgi:hypothetical protein